MVVVDIQDVAPQFSTARYDILPPAANKSQTEQSYTMSRKWNCKQEYILEDFRRQREEWQEGIATKVMLLDTKV
jgi:hypothetical protein